MITRVLITASCALLAHAHALHIINPRQGPPAPTTTLPPAATATDAVPLDQIVPNSVRETDTTTIPVPTPTAGSTPSGIPNAPTLPSLANWAQMQSGYPSPDPAVPMDVTNPQVVQWVQQVQGSGVQIPNIAPYKYNLTGQNCADPDNVARRANWESDGWWTCGHYTRPTDIVECTRPKVWGSSFDDGPSDNDGKLLGYLGQQNIKTTFFAVGTAIYWRPWILQAEYIAGHQIAVHTWSHSPLTTLSNEAIIAQLGWSKKIIKDVLGVTPLYFRPPYGDIDDRVRAIARAMQLTPVMWTVTGTLDQPFAFDTFDTLVPGGSVTAVQSVTQFQLLLQQADQFGKGFLVLSHDLFWQQVDLSIGYFLPSAVARGYQLTPVYDCAGQTLVNAYAETRSGNDLPGGSTGNGGSSSGTSGPGQSTSRSNGPTGTSTSGSGSPSHTGAPDSAMPLLDSLTTVAAFAVAGVLSYITTL